MQGISGDWVLVLVVLAGVAVLQFYQGRRLNIALIKHYVHSFESVLTIRDQLYTWIGGYSGFKVVYDVDEKSIKKVEMTLTLLSRQSLFWLPFSYPVKKGDRLYIVLRPSFKVRADAHIVRNFYYLFGPGITEIKDLTRGKAEFAGAKGFYTLYEQEGDIAKLKKLVEASMDPKRLRHIAVVKKTNVLFCLIKPDPLKTPDELKRLVENFPKYFSSGGTAN
jgi:hypothetical protein